LLLKKRKKPENCPSIIGLLSKDLIEFLKKIKDEIGKNICAQKENFALLKWFHQREIKSLEVAKLIYF